MRKKKIDTKGLELLERRVWDFCISYLKEHAKNPSQDEVDIFMETQLKIMGVKYDVDSAQRMMALLWMKEQSGFLEHLRSLAKK